MGTLGLLFFGKVADLPLVVGLVSHPALSCYDDKAIEPLRTIPSSAECLAGGAGLEPTTTESKSVVLPLHHPPRIGAFLPL